MRQGMISRYEYSLIIILSLVGSVFLVSLQESVIGKDTYIALLGGLALGIVINILFLSMLKNCGYRRLSCISTLLFKQAGDAVTVAFSIYFLFSGVILLNYYGVFTVKTILEDMPVTVLFVAITAVVMLASEKGVSVMGRMGTVFSYVLLPCVVLSFLLELPQLDTENLLPALSSDREKLLEMIALFGFLQFGDVISVFCLTSYLDNKKNIIKLSVISAAVGGFIVFLFCFLNAACLGDSLIYQYSGFLRVMKLVDLGGVLNRLEVLVVAGYFFATVFRLMIVYFVVSDNLCGVFNKKKDPRIKWGILIFCSFFTVITAQAIKAEEVIKSIYPYLAFLFQIVLPAVMFALSLKLRQRC